MPNQDSLDLAKEESSAQRRLKEAEIKLAEALDDYQQLDDKYRSLLGKVSSIRTTLGDRLKLDAVRFVQRIISPSICLYLVNIGRIGPV